CEVDDLEEAVGDYPIIEKLSSPEDAVFTCYINVKGTPVELIQFEGHEEEIARPSPSQQNLDYHHFWVNSSF
ncbi:MAG: hypothetical protein JXL97_06130, partial [Bacteroidales bacterium]|nr:hypothetical protein [Bacteroidales bacterium]